MLSELKNVGVNWGDIDVKMNISRGDIFDTIKFKLDDGTIDPEKSNWANCFFFAEQVPPVYKNTWTDQIDELLDKPAGWKAYA
ncbi:hypothetical protein DICVIV_02056 [Dictyocaulus viviparus]|uniref:Uncharacterized protein n=1 Tax=Dictyocaulus viviparus TaxID=29172 RepID=A0A0D8Y4V6_DICVI|nr:hypothetical protein DICVIV_02056 [Dictyocaulus viviparus]